MTRSRNDTHLVDRIVRRLRRTYRPTQVILFGSYAYGSPTKESDVDLLIVKATSKPFYQRLFEVRRLVSPMLQGRPFDPIVLTPKELSDRIARGDQFLSDIVAKGRRVYGDS